MALEVLGISDRQNEWASGHDYMSMGMREREEIFKENEIVNKVFKIRH